MNTISSKGQTLIEVIVALAVVMLILAAISVAITTSVSNSTFIKNQNLASKYAQSGMEHLRHLYANQEDFYEAYSDPGVYYMDESNNIAQGFSTIYEGQFVRRVDFDIGVECDTSLGAPTDNDELRITVSVFWTSGKCKGDDPVEKFCHKSELVTCFTERKSGLDL